MNAGQSFALWKNIATFAPNMPCLSLCQRQTTACGTPVELVSRTVAPRCPMAHTTGLTTQQRVPTVSVLKRQCQARIEAGSNNSYRPKNIFV